MSRSGGVSNALHLLGEKVVSLGAIAAANVVILRTLGPDIYGNFGAATAILAMCMPLTLFGSVMIVRSLSRLDRPTRQLVSLAIMLSLVGALAGAVIMAVLGGFDLLGQPTSSILLILIVALLARPLSAVDVWFQAGSRNPQATRIRTVVTVVSAVARSYIAVSTGSLVLLAVLIVVENIVAGVWLQLERVRLSRRDSFSLADGPLAREDRREILSSSLTYLVYAASVILFMRVDQPMLLLLADSTAVGIYAAAANLSDSLSFFPNALLTAALPILLKLAVSSFPKFVSKAANLVAIGAGLGYFMALGGIVASPLIIPLLYGVEYQDSVLLLQVLLIGVPFLFVGVMRTPQILHDNLQREVMWIGIISLALNVALNFVLIPLMGALGAAVSTTICHVVNGVVGNVLFPRTRHLVLVQIRALRPDVALVALWRAARTRQI